MKNIKPIKNNKELKAVLQSGPDYWSDNTYRSITATVDDYFNLKFETKDMQQELKQGHNPVDSDTLVGDKHPHMSDDLKTNYSTLHQWKPLVQRLSTTDAGKQEVKAMHNIEQMSGVRKVLNQHPNYAKQIHLYSGQQVLNYMHKLIKSDKGFGLNDEADTEQAVSNDVNPRGVYGDLVKNGDMDGEFTVTPEDFKHNIDWYARDNMSIKNAFGLVKGDLSSGQIRQKTNKLIFNNKSKLKTKLSKAQHNHLIDLDTKLTYLNSRTYNKPQMKMNSSDFSNDLKFTKAYKKFIKSDYLQEKQNLNQVEELQAIKDPLAQMNFLNKHNNIRKVLNIKKHNEPSNLKIYNYMNKQPQQIKAYRRVLINTDNQIQNLESSPRYQKKLNMKHVSHILDKHPEYAKLLMVYSSKQMIKHYKKLGYGNKVNNIKPNAVYDDIDKLKPLTRKQFINGFIVSSGNKANQMKKQFGITNYEIAKVNYEDNQAKYNHTGHKRSFSEAVKRNQPKVNKEFVKNSQKQLNQSMLKRGQAQNHGIER